MLLNGIIKNTVKKFNELNSNNDDLIAVVGPCIDKKNYEVKNDFLKNLLTKIKKMKFFLKRFGNEKYIFDLKRFYK